MVGGRKGEGISKEFSKFFGKEGGELGALVRDDFVIESKSRVDSVVKNLGDVKGGGSFCGR